jgi:hypothetical protein
MRDRHAATSGSRRSQLIARSNAAAPPLSTIAPWPRTMRSKVPLEDLFERLARRLAVSRRPSDATGYAEGPVDALQAPGPTCRQGRVWPGLVDEEVSDDQRSSGAVKENDLGE